MSDVLFSSHRDNNRVILDISVLREDTGVLALHLSPQPGIAYEVYKEIIRVLISNSATYYSPSSVELNEDIINHNVDICMDELAINRALNQLEVRDDLARTILTKGLHLIRKILHSADLLDYGNPNKFFLVETFLDQETVVLTEFCNLEDTIIID